jgi:hypothetical protein
MTTLDQNIITEVTKSLSPTEIEANAAHARQKPIERVVMR